MQRRRFIQLLGLTALFWQSRLRDLFAATGAVVAVAEGTDHARITRNAINALGGMKRFVKPGNTVVVKPNMGWDRTPELAANTNPLVVRAVVEECLQAGAKKVKVFDRTCNDERRCYMNSGIESCPEGAQRGGGQAPRRGALQEGGPQRQRPEGMGTVRRGALGRCLSSMCRC